MRTSSEPESIQRPSTVKTTTFTARGGRFTAKKTRELALALADDPALKVQYLFQKKLLQMPRT